MGNTKTKEEDRRRKEEENKKVEEKKVEEKKVEEKKVEEKKVEEKKVEEKKVEEKKVEEKKVAEKKVEEKKVAEKKVEEKKVEEKKAEEKKVEMTKEEPQNKDKAEEQRPAKSTRADEKFVKEVVAEMMENLLRLVAENDFYRELSLPLTANKKEVDAAYRKTATKYHLTDNSDKELENLNHIYDNYFQDEMIHKVYNLIVLEDRPKYHLIPLGQLANLEDFLNRTENLLKLLSKLESEKGSDLSRLKKEISLAHHILETLVQHIDPSRKEETQPQLNLLDLLILMHLMQQEK